MAQEDFESVLNALEVKFLGHDAWVAVDVCDAGTLSLYDHMASAVEVHVPVLFQFVGEHAHAQYGAVKDVKITHHGDVDQSVAD